MAKYKDAGKVRNNYTLEQDADKLIRHYTMIEGHKNMSNFIEHLVFKHDAENNPAKQLREIERKRELIREEMQEIENKKESVIKKMAMKEEAGKILNQDKERAIGIMIRKIKEGNTIWELQNLMKTWSYRLGITYEELNFAVAMRMKEMNLKAQEQGREIVERGGYYGKTNVRG